MYIYIYALCISDMYMMYIHNWLYHEEVPGKSEMAILAIFVPAGGGFQLELDRYPEHSHLCKSGVALAWMRRKRHRVASCRH